MKRFQRKCCVTLYISSMVLLIILGTIVMWVSIIKSLLKNNNNIDKE